MLIVISQVNYPLFVICQRMVSVQKLVSTRYFESIPGSSIHSLPGNSRGLYKATSEKRTTSEQRTKAAVPKCPLFRGLNVLCNAPMYG